MATQFIKQAESQLNPVFAQQQQALQSQIPSIENLYNTLTQGLQQNYQTSLNSGVQGIVEDASARGVLRSTLPVDARQSLTAQLGTALQQGIGELGARRAGDIAGIRTQIGDLGLKRASAVTELSRALETQDLERQRLALDKLNSEREYQLASQSASQGAATAAPPPLSVGLTELFNGYKPAYQGGTPYYTENYVIPTLMQAYGLSESEAKKRAYAYRKQTFGEGAGG